MLAFCQTSGLQPRQRLCASAEESSLVQQSVRLIAASQCKDTGLGWLQHLAGMPAPGGERLCLTGLVAARRITPLRSANRGALPAGPPRARNRSGRGIRPIYQIAPRRSAEPRRSRRRERRAGTGGRAPSAPLLIAVGYVSPWTSAAPRTAAPVRQEARFRLTALPQPHLDWSFVQFASA
jgi:hypothetical protein